MLKHHRKRISKAQATALSHLDGNAAAKTLGLDAKSCPQLRLAGSRTRLPSALDTAVEPQPDDSKWAQSPIRWEGALASGLARHDPDNLCIHTHVTGGLTSSSVCPSVGLAPSWRARQQNSAPLPRPRGAAASISTDM